MTDIALIDSDPRRSARIADDLATHGIRVACQQNLSAAQKIEADCALVMLGDNASDWPAMAEMMPTIVLDEPGAINTAVACMRDGAVDYLSWPAEADRLVAAIERASAISAKSVGAALAEFPMIGESENMKMLKEMIAKAGPTNSTVLIYGQSGTGKELVARAIHASSQRVSAPLLSINCATVPGNLIEAELFGTEPDRENPNQRTAGLVEAANGGTLFLDEIAELPQSAQAKLLQVLDGENRRMGGSAPIAVDIRLIAATHRDLQKLVDSGQFRKDLYYRLKVVCLQLPVLRARQDDVLIIADWLLKRTSRRLDKSDLSFSDEARRAMLAYHWPGNVRELENAVERAVILSDNGTSITQSLLAIEPAPEPEAPLTTAPNGDLTSLEDYFVKFVQQHQDHLTETELAEKLGISRKSLWERRQRLNIPRRKTRKRGPRQDSASEK